MRFIYMLEGVGWATARLADGDHHVDMTVSYLHDSLGQLAEVVMRLSEGQSDATVVFMDEPGEHHLVLHREDDGMVTAQVRWFNDWASWQMHPADQYEVVFEAKSSLAVFRDAVVAELGSILAEHGLAGYREKWVEHDFPQETYERLLCV